MPISLRYDPGKKILYATIEKNFTLVEFADALKKITQSDDYSPDTGILWDARSIYMPDGNRQLVLNIIEIRKKFPAREKAKVAIIAPADFTYGMSRMFQVLSDAKPLLPNIMVFRNFTEGEEWLIGIEK